MSSLHSANFHFATNRKSYNSAVNAIIRPERRTYSVEELGPQSFQCQGRDYFRFDCTFKNSKGEKLMGSWWRANQISKVRGNVRKESMPDTCMSYRHYMILCLGM